MNPRLLLIIVALSGALNLSYEMLWVRAYSFSIGARAVGFPVVLGTYLIGLAFGAAIVPYFAKKHDSADKRSLRLLAIFIGVGNLFSYLVVPSVGLIAASSEQNLGVPLIPIFFAALFLGTHFPLLTHYGIPANERAGLSIGLYYLSNIIGSVLGTFVTGWFLMDLLGIADISSLLILAGGILSLVTFYFGKKSSTHFWIVCALSITIFGGAILSKDVLFDRLYDKLTFWSEYEKNSPAVKIVENRSGVLLRLKDGSIVGGGAYDGELHVDLMNDKNTTLRPFALSAFIDAPKTILVLGVGSGSWLRVAVNHPDVERVVVVEINPGYKELLKGTVGEDVLTHPKIEYYDDDVRRWLNHHPDEKFDAFVCNASFNWRSMATSLSSVEFFELVKSRLNKKGVLLLNTTGSARTYRTAFEVFGEVNRVSNSFFATPDKFDFSIPRLRKNLLRYRIEGKPILDQNSKKHMDYLDFIERTFQQNSPAKTGEDRFNDYAWNDHDNLWEMVKDETPITDDNLGDEFSGSIF